MSIESFATNFLENHDLWQSVLNSNLNHANSNSLTLQETKTTGTVSSLSLYKSLAFEFDQFLQDRYLDNILLVINGIDRHVFSSVGNPYLISEAHNRLQPLLFGNRLVTADCESEIHVLWFPPIPIDLIELEGAQTETIKQNLIRFFENELGLMVNEVVFSYITDGLGWEEFFYERYFLPKKFMEITGISNLVIPNSENEVSIMDCIEDGKTEWLKAQVNGQLPQPLKFDIQLSEPYIPSDSTTLFMPFVRAELHIPTHMTATEMINLVNQAFQILECSEQGGQLTLLCMSPEGPYAETTTDIVTNIRELLCPLFIQFFSEHNLEWQNLTFILTNTEL
ncbi:hypothetical protein D3C74_271330 [compost metagenome]